MDSCLRGDQDEMGGGPVAWCTLGRGGRHPQLAWKYADNHWNSVRSVPVYTWTIPLKDAELKIKEHP